jgi:hypothetical protein
MKTGTYVYLLYYVLIVCINYLLQMNDRVFNNNNNNKGSRGMGEVAPLYGVDPALVPTNLGVE